MISGAHIRSAVTTLFDTAAAAGPVTPENALEAAQRLRGRRIVIDRSTELPLGVCGRWVAFTDYDLVQVQAGGVTADWTTLHELGHMLLGHQGRSATELASAEVEVAGSSIVTYMLTRGGPQLTALEQQQEAEAESFARLLTSRIDAVRGSPAPTMTARLDETLS